MQGCPGKIEEVLQIASSGNDTLQSRECPTQDPEFCPAGSICPHFVIPSAARDLCRWLYRSLAALGMTIFPYSRSRVIFPGPPCIQMGKCPVLRGDGVMGLARP